MESSKNQEGRPIRPTLLIILDGFGLSHQKNQGNAITAATAPHIFGYMDEYSSTTLIAHGKDVGLFPNQEGNSEAGHLNIGAGRLVKQDLVRISDAIADGTFFKNESFDQALFHAEKYHSAVHVMGILTNGQSAHAHNEHLYALLKYFDKKNFSRVFLHIFTDGRDSPPHSAVGYLRELCSQKPRCKITIASVTGRFYAMDRNKIWERTELAYNAIVMGKAKYTARFAEEAVGNAYNRGETDEYISPTVIVDDNNKPVAPIQDHDVIYFFNARSDRARQLTKALIQKNFQKENQGAFKRKKWPKNIRLVAMTDFGPDLPGVFTAFPSPDEPNCLAKAIGDQYRQLYISETEKYAHMTYFINGGYAEPINGEVRELIKSHKKYSYADEPQMNGKEVIERILGHLDNDDYNFVAVNFPNADMVGHTGNVEAAKKAVSYLDDDVKKLVDAFLKKDGLIMITADHGNAEKMIDPETGEVFTEHTTSPVPLIVISRDEKKIKLKKGRLADVAPTLLKLMGVKKPKEMTGKTLF